TNGHDVLRLSVEKHEFPVKHPLTKIALLWSHGTGFHKEMLHPLMRRFLHYLRSKAEYDHIHVDFISWDSRNHGDSARLTPNVTGNSTMTGLEIGLDAVQVIQKLKLKQEYDLVIGVGHSAGATALLLAEFIQPHIFDGICAIEPVLRTEILDQQKRAKLETCFKSLSTKPFWKKWHPEALNNFVKFGLYNTDENTVKLKCTKEQENLMYWNDNFDPFVCFATLRLLSIPTHIVLSNESSAHTIVLAPAKDVAKQSSMITTRVVDGSHMVPFEDPDVLGRGV
ncbi:Alpha/beta hydrolase fold-1, partial [Fennellomyces sp. T-0311]